MSAGETLQRPAQCSVCKNTAKLEIHTGHSGMPFLLLSHMRIQIILLLVSYSSDGRICFFKTHYAHTCTRRDKEKSSPGLSNEKKLVRYFSGAPHHHQGFMRTVGPVPQGNISWHYSFMLAAFDLK